MTNNPTPRVWSFPTEPDDCTSVRDRNGQLWLAPGRPGNNLWWKDKLGRGLGWEWPDLLLAHGPLTADPQPMGDGLNAASEQVTR